jgi:hypothetical protein
MPLAPLLFEVTFVNKALSGSWFSWLMAWRGRGRDEGGIRKASDPEVQQKTPTSRTSKTWGDRQHGDKGHMCSHTSSYKPGSAAVD